MNGDMETAEKLKEQAEELSKKYEKIEEMYCLDTNMLKKKIETQRFKYKALEDEYENIYEKYKMLTIDVRTSQKFCLKQKNSIKMIVKIMLIQ